MWHPIILSFYPEDRKVLRTLPIPNPTGKKTLRRAEASYPSVSPKLSLVALHRAPRRVAGDGHVAGHDRGAPREV